MIFDAQKLYICKDREFVLTRVLVKRSLKMLNEKICFSGRVHVYPKFSDLVVHFGNSLTALYFSMKFKQCFFSTFLVNKISLI